MIGAIELVVIIILCIIGPIFAIGLISNKKYCKYCSEEAVVECTTYDNKKVYMCGNCLRAFRFREKECFKSVLPYCNGIK